MHGPLGKGGQHRERQHVADPAPFGHAAPPNLIELVCD
jgi:hypothetical protein